jgi:Ca-activated chloride channel homolog
MPFLQPAAFALLALIPIVIAMYLLKLRRTEQAVSSIYLWRRMVRDLEANAPWQRLRRNLLLLLQILFLLALILALTRPYVVAEGLGSHSTILILDTSASMAATDLSPNRMEAAKTRARQIVDELPGDARVTVIAAGQTAQVMVASSQDRRQVFQAINAIQGYSAGTDLASALELASAIAARTPDTEIIVFSDGRVVLPERLALRGILRYLPFGLRGDNQAISLFTLETAPSSENLTAFLQVSNYAQAGTPPADRRLSLYADGRLIHALDLEVGPGQQQAVVLPGLPLDIQTLEARLTPEDLLPLDDRAWAVNRIAQPVHVTLVSAGNLFLETALSLLPGVELTVVAPQDWETAEVATGITQPARMTVFDVYTPQNHIATGDNLLFIGPTRSTDYFTITGTVEQPRLRLADISSPLLAGMTLVEEIGVLDAARLAMPDWSRLAITGDLEGETYPMLVYGETGGQRVSVLAFDLRRSDLPLNVAFPILLSNLIRWLALGSFDLPRVGGIGEALSFGLPPDVLEATWIRPDGSSTRLQAREGRFLIPELVQAGIHQVRWEGGESAFAVNLFSPQESDLHPADRLSLASAAEPSQVGAGIEQARREFWRPLAILALVLLTLEWLVYQRATLVRLWQGVIRRGSEAQDREIPRTFSK